ncbi:MAG: UDP-N-acetylglucosamine 2-epimerase [Ruthenibacterium sp.]
MKQYTVAVVTGTRAEYGLLRGVLDALAASEVLTPQLLVTGAHLAPEFGGTVKEIEADGRAIAARIPILELVSGTGTPYATAKIVAHALDKFTDYFHANRPDAVLVLGDRYEIFAVGAAAALLEIPLLHISGGDVTQGAADDYFRHCLTKMAALHFPSCETYAQRIIRMGEAPETVHNVGGLGDENLRRLPLLSRAALAQSLDYDVTKPYVLATYHPETAGGEPPAQQFAALLRALSHFDVGCIFTKANADAGGAQINALIDAACAENSRDIAFTSMGVLRYLSAMQYCAVVVGNSSSGVVETPTLGIPAVNIGTRQQGRIVCDNVLCCAANEQSIAAALQTALTPAFAEKAHKTVSPYNGGNTAEKIVRIIEEFLQSPGCDAPKRFYDGTQGARA